MPVVFVAVFVIFVFVFVAVFVVFSFGRIDADAEAISAAFGFVLRGMRAAGPVARSPVLVAAATRSTLFGVSGSTGRLFRR